MAQVNYLKRALHLDLSTHMDGTKFNCGWTYNCRTWAQVMRMHNGLMGSTTSKHKITQDIFLLLPHHSSTNIKAKGWQAANTSQVKKKPQPWVLKAVLNTSSMPTFFPLQYWRWNSGPCVGGKPSTSQPQSSAIPSIHLPVLPFFLSLPPSFPSHFPFFSLFLLPF